MNLQSTDIQGISDTDLTTLIGLLHNCNHEALSMKGYIRTREKCPSCGSKFQLVHDKFIVCPQCLQIPNRVFIEICWKGKQYKIYSDTDGRPLKTYEHANRVLSEIRQKIDKHRFDPVDYISTRYHKLQVSSYARKWLVHWESNVEIGEGSKLTLENKKIMVEKYFIPFFKDLDIRDIRPGDIEDFVLQLPKDLALSTRHSILVQLKAMFNWAKRRRDIKYVPEFPRIKQIKSKTIWAGTEIQDRIFDQISERHKPIFLFMMRLGVRPGEARALQWKDINWQDKTVSIRRTFSGNKLKDTTKTDQERTLPLDDDVYAMLKARKALGFVFTTNKGKPYITRTTLNYAWDKACEMAGVEHISLYAGTRHSFASQAIKKKHVDLYTVQRFLGHSSPVTTQRYAHLETDGLRVALREEKVKEFRSKVSPKLGANENEA